MDHLEEMIGSDKKIIRAMPNTPAMVGQAMSALEERTQNEVAHYLVEQLVDLFTVIAECIRDGLMLEHADPLPSFADMLNEEYLWSEEYDEDEDILRYEEEAVFPDDLFFSFYYYSLQVLLLCKPLLDKNNKYEVTLLELLTEIDH